MTTSTSLPMKTLCGNSSNPEKGNTAPAIPRPGMLCRGQRSSPFSLQPAAEPSVGKRTGNPGRSCTRRDAHKGDQQGTRKPDSSLLYAGILKSRMFSQIPVQSMKPPPGRFFMGGGVCHRRGPWGGQPLQNAAGSSIIPTPESKEQENREKGQVTRFSTRMKTDIATVIIITGIGPMWTARLSSLS